MAEVEHGMAEGEPGMAEVEHVIELSKELGRRLMESGTEIYAAEQVLNLAIELGYRLLESGAEIYRVEDSMNRLLQAYGQETGEVFVIPSCIIVSLTAKGQSITRLRRMPNHGTDVYLLERYNALCRHLCQERPSYAKAKAQIAAIGKERLTYPFWAQLCAYFVGTGSFTLFFGGTLRDGFCGGLCGVAIGLSLTAMTRWGANLFFKTIAGGTVSALLALLLAFVGLGENADFITIGGLMALVPGVIFTNAIRDIMAGDLIAGINKVVEALLIGTAIALGTGFALYLSRGLMGV